MSLFASHSAACSSDHCTTSSRTIGSTCGTTIAGTTPPRIAAIKSQRFPAPGRRPPPGPVAARPNSTVPAASFAAASNSAGIGKPCRSYRMWSPLDAAVAVGAPSMVARSRRPEQLTGAADVA
jgi:hypothetical protein